MENRMKGAPEMTTQEVLAFVERHGLVLASARHASVPSLAAAVAGEPIAGSWWAHPKSHAIFAALSVLDGRDDVVFTRLVDGKLTIVHARLWPVLAALSGRIDRARLAKVKQEHTPSGKHVTHEEPFPDWLPAELPSVSEADALRALGAPLAASLLQSSGATPRSRGSGGPKARARRR
jgi:hypothetical protein